MFDKGYYTAEQIHDTQQLGVTTHVCIPAPAGTAPDPAYNVSEFTYNSKEDTYTCPARETLKTNGNWYQKKSYQVKQYKTKSCKGCPVKLSCTRSKSQRIIERHEFAEAIEINKKNINDNPDIYAQRQAIVEHPFGTMKRGWGYDHIITKRTKERASADVGLIFVAYSLRRIINIIGVKQLMEYISQLTSILRSTKHPKCAIDPLQANWLFRIHVFRLIDLTNRALKNAYFHTKLKTSGGF